MAKYDITVSSETFRLLKAVGQHYNLHDADMALRRACSIAIDKINTDVATKANEQFAKHCENWMLHPASFDEANAVFGPPEGKTEEEVYSLVAARIKWGDDDAVLSCWKPTQEQLDLIQETGRLWIALMCRQMVPICVMSQKPLDFEGIELNDE